MLEAFIARCYEALGLRVNRRKCAAMRAAAALPLLQDEVPADGNGPGGDAPHRGRPGAAGGKCARWPPGATEGVRAQIVSAKGYYKSINTTTTDA